MTNLSINVCEEYRYRITISYFTDIPMETLDPTQPNQIRILYYVNPGRFYVYHPDKINSHTSVNTKLFFSSDI